MTTATLIGARRRPPRRRALSAGAAVLVLVIAAISAFGPLLLMLANAGRSAADILSAPIGLPTIDDVVRNFTKAWVQGNFQTYFANSLWITALSVSIGVALAVLAAYGLGRFAFRGRSAVSIYFIAGLLIPAQIGILPVFSMLDGLGLINNPLSLVIMYVVKVLPLSIFVLLSFVQALPVELEEAARLDGANEFTVFRAIMLPLIRPAIVTVFILQAPTVWNDFFYPLVLMRDKANYTLPMGLSSFIGQYQTDYGTLFAGLAIVSVPLLLLFVVASRWVVAGLTAGMGK